MTQALSCSTGGLVIACHKKIRDELLYLSQQVFTPVSVRAKHLTHKGCTRSELEICQLSDKDKNTWSEVVIRGLWDGQAEAIIEVKLGDTDIDSYKYEPMAVILDWWGTIKKYKHGKHCNNQQRHFSPFVLSVDRMLVREALVILAQLSRTMAEKREEPLSQVRGWVNGQIAIAVARSYSRMIRRAQLPSPLLESDHDWDLESGIGLAG